MKKKRKSRRANPIARALRSPALKPRVVKPKKGKGSYRRRARTTREN
jgi:stalled ribosome alternative rescue factor ArfA